MSGRPNINDTMMNVVKDFKITKTASDMNISIKRSLSGETESFDTPIKRYKTTLDLSYVGSPREMNRMRLDLLEARNTIMDLNNKIKHMHSVRNEVQIMFESETASLRRQHDYDRKTIDELEEQLQIIRKREKGFQDELKELQKKYQDYHLASEDTMFELERTVNNLKEDSRSVSIDSSFEQNGLKREILELKTMLEAAQQDAEAQKKLATELGKQLKQQTSISNDLDTVKVELNMARNKIWVLENAKENYMDYQQQAKVQMEKLAKYNQLENENLQLKEDFSRLKENLKNKLLLEEEVYTLKSRLVKHKELEQKVAELQTKSDQTQLYLNEWRAVARGVCETTDNDAVLPHLLRTKIERLQQQELTLLADKVEFESKFKSAEHAAKVAEAELQKNKKLIVDLKKSGDDKQNLIHRIQKKLKLVIRERDSYRLQLDSYEKDLTMVFNGASQESDIGQSQRDRIENLEKIVDGYRDMVAKLENDLQESEPQQDAVPVRQEQINRMQDELAKLRNDNELLRQQRNELEVRLESLSVNTQEETFRAAQVLHTVNNPLTICLRDRQLTVEELQEENLRLKNKIKKLEQGIETSRLGEISICPQEVNALKEQIKSNEKQTQRLKDYFKSSMQDFRNVVYMLFGYKIDRPSNSSIYKLRSMYAQQVEDLLCFEVSQDGDLNLLQNEFSANLQSMIELHLLEQKSIPVFLSAITIDLFNQTTNNF